MANDFSQSEEEKVKRMDQFRQKFESAFSSQKWEIESTDRYYYLSGRYSKTYTEVTFWYNPFTLERKETIRSQYISYGEEYKLPDWCRSCEYRKSLNYE